MADEQLLAPFPWFGGKSRVAGVVWEGLGDVDTYVEPFAGSLAVLLGRPKWHTGVMEIVNDADQYIANFWRAVQAAPDEVAHYADWPCNEADLHSRHLWLVTHGRQQMQAGLASDPEWYDAKIAGWWVWGISNWIGGGWCRVPSSNDGDAVVRTIRRIPHLTSSQGVNSQRVAGNIYISKQRPHLASGKGVNSQRVAGDIYDYMQRLSERLRHVIVVCGDWSRVVTHGALSKARVAGIFLDPPYSDTAGRDSNIYAVDSLDVAHDVRNWAIANGDNPRYRIVLAGYEGEHDMPPGWRKYAWTAFTAYQTSRGAGRNGAQNRFRERLWVSPHCLALRQPALLEME